MRALVLLLAFFPASAMAGNAIVSWVNPTEYTDGTPLAPSALGGTRIQHGACPDFGVIDGEVIAPAGDTTYTITGLPAGLRCFRAYARDTAGLESVASNTAQKDVAASSPAPPTGLTVVATVVYTVVKQVDRFVMLPVGTVPADTACNSANSVSNDTGTYYAVPRHLVTWSGSVRPDVVVAQCG